MMGREQVFSGLGEAAALDQHPGLKLWSTRPFPLHGAYPGCAALDPKVSIPDDQKWAGCGMGAPGYRSGEADIGGMAPPSQLPED